MIPFDFGLFGRVVYLSFFASKKSDARLTMRRAFSLVLGVSAFLFLEIGNFVFLLLDELLFPRYRDVEIRRQPVSTDVQKSEKQVLGDFVDLHPTGLFHFEEDEMLLLHCFSSRYLVFFFPFYDPLQKFGLLDKRVRISRREQILKFYQRCLMRQVYVRGAQKTALSKNPMFQREDREPAAAIPRLPVRLHAAKPAGSDSVDAERRPCQLRFRGPR